MESGVFIGVVVVVICNDGLVRVIDLPASLNKGCVRKNPAHGYVRRSAAMLAGSASKDEAWLRRVITLGCNKAKESCVIGYVSDLPIKCKVGFII